jgi:hypothetical protein
VFRLVFVFIVDLGILVLSTHRRGDFYPVIPCNTVAADSGPAAPLSQIQKRIQSNYI